MRRKFVLVLIGLLLLGVAAFYYIDNIFLPVQLKNFITNRAQKFLGREVSVGSIDFRPIKGFIIKNVFIARKEDPARAMLTVDEITFNLLLTPLFRQQTVILPDIRVRNPYLYVFRGEDGVWNFADLPGLAGDAKERNRFSILLRKLTLEGGKVQVRDRSKDTEFFESLEDIALDATLSLNKGVRFVLSAKVPKQQTVLKIKGNYGFLPRKLTAQVTVDNLALARYLPLTYTARPYTQLTKGVLSSANFGAVFEERRLEVQGGFFANDVTVEAGAGRRMSGAVHVPSMRLTWRDNKWNASGQLRLPSVHMTSGDGQELSGHVRADLNLLTVHANRLSSQGDVTVEKAVLVLDGKKVFRGDIDASNASLVKGDGRVRVQGNFNIKNTSIAAGPLLSLEGDLATTGTDLVWSRDAEGNNTFTMQSGLAMDNARAAFPGERAAAGNLSVHKASLFVDRDHVEVEALGQLGDADIVLDADRHFRGSPYFNVFVANDLTGKTPVDYKGTFRFTEATLTGLPAIASAEHVEGIVALMPDHLQTDRLAFTTQGTAFTLSGLLTGFADPDVKIKASTEALMLQKLVELFPAIKAKVPGELTGQAAVDLSYSGSMSAPAKARIAVSARLSNTTFIPEKLAGSFKNISGVLYYADDLLAWRDLKATYGDKAYRLNGSLSNFSRPVVETGVIGDDLTLSARIKVLRAALQFTDLAGQYLNSTFNIKGDAHFPADAPADVDLRGAFTLDLGDLGRLAPPVSDRVKALALDGTVSGEGVFKGTLRDWRDWQLALDLNSEKLAAGGLTFTNAALRYTQRDRAVSKCNLTAKVYGGALLVSSSADLREEATPFHATIELKNMDLAQYQQAKATKNPQLAGTLTLVTDLEGKAAAWRAMTGAGTLQITDGHLWQWNILSGLSKALLIPEFNNFVFTEAHSDFVVGDGRVRTENAQMSGLSATLLGKGWIDFDRVLNFRITPTFSQIAIERSASLKKGITSILTQTNGYLTIKLTGPLEKPKFSVEKNPMKIIEGAIGDTANTLKGVLEGVIQEINK